jgi:cytochrome c553
MKIQYAGVALILCLALNAQAADIEAGRGRSLACQACHGSSGIGTAPDIPNLAGQKTAYLQAQLTAFRKGERKHELMNAIAAQLNDADIENLAAFWGSLPAGDTAAPDLASGMRQSRMSFPADFPKGFVMYHEEKDEANNLAKRSYANHAAVTAARAGKPLPDGSAIVVENYANGAVASYAAMEARLGWGKDIPELLRNGDWSYALFDGKKTLRDTFNYARCLACHKPKADSSYVFGLQNIRVNSQ